MRAVLLASLMVLTAAAGDRPGLSEAADHHGRAVRTPAGRPTQSRALRRKAWAVYSAKQSWSRTLPVRAARSAAIVLCAPIPTDYTILLHHLGLATAVALYRKLPFNPVTDLKPVGVVSDVNMAIIARPDYAPNTLAK